MEAPAIERWGFTSGQGYRPRLPGPIGSVPVGPGKAAGMGARSNCVPCQAVVHALAIASSSLQRVPFLIIVLRMHSSLLMQAVSATLGFLPAARSRW